jgi:hypothetical protein
MYACMCLCLYVCIYVCPCVCTSVYTRARARQCTLPFFTPAFSYGSQDLFSVVFALRPSGPSLFLDKATIIPGARAGKLYLSSTTTRCG